MKDLNEMKKEELVNLVCELEDCLIMLEDKFSRGKSFKKGRKDEVLELLKEVGRISVGDISKKLGISSRNVSSQLSYLRKDGILIGTDSKKRKFIEVD